MKIKIRRITPAKGHKSPLPSVTKKGDWIDLYTREEVLMQPMTYKEIPLGVAVELPMGYEAICVPRSSTFKKHGIILANSFGVIDWTYSGNSDEWKFPAIALNSIETVKIPSNTRIAQFRVQLSQKASVWQKLKWLFSGKIEIVEVDVLTNRDRGGIGSTGEK